LRAELDVPLVVHRVSATGSTLGTISGAGTVDKGVLLSLTANVQAVICAIIGQHPL
jgi:hypothetical protein